MKTFSKQSGGVYLLPKADGRADILIGSPEKFGGRCGPGARAEMWGGRCWLDIAAAGVDIGSAAEKIQPMVAGKPHGAKARGNDVLMDALHIGVKRRMTKQGRWADETHRIYPGSLEWDVTWASLADVPEPATPGGDPVVEFNLDFPAGLEFHYQPELTPDEIARGCVRPDDVISSYAVYMPSLANNIVDRWGNLIHEGQTGKFSHIYRPKLIDANGAETWCTQQIDPAAGILRIILPAAWLQAAAFPVALDPTFGFVTKGGTEQGGASANYIITGGPFTSGVTIGKITAISWYLKGAGIAITFGLFTNSGTAPSRLICTTAAGSSPTDDWLTLTATPPGFVEATTNYHLGHCSNATFPKTYYDSVAGNYYDQCAFTYVAGGMIGVFISGSNLNSYKFSAYATYSVLSAGSVSKSRIIGGV